MESQQDQSSAQTWMKSLLESNVYFRRVLFIKNQKVISTSYISFEEMESNQHLKRPAINETSIVQAIIEIFYFLRIAAEEPPPPNVGLPKCKVAFKRQSYMNEARSEMDVCILLCACEEKGHKNPEKYEKESITWLMTNEANLIGQCKKIAENKTSNLIDDFRKQLKKVCVFANGKPDKLTIASITQVTKHIEGTDLFRSKATLVRFATYSIMGLTKIDTNKPSGRNLENPDNKVGQLVKHVALLMHIRLEQEFWKQNGSQNFGRVSSREVMQEGQMQSETQINKVQQQKQNELMQRFVKNVMHQLTSSPIDDAPLKKIYMNQTEEYRNQQKFGGIYFLEANIFGFLEQVMQLQQKESRNKTRNWLFKRKITVKFSSTPLIKAGEVGYMLGYSHVHQIIEVVMITDILIKKENQEFIWGKVMLLKQCMPFLNISNDTHKEGNEMRTYITIRVFDKYPTQQQQRNRPPMLLRMVQLMDQAAIILTCIRPELQPQTFDDLNLKIDSELPRETQHYMRLVQNASCRHYLDNEYFKALR